MIIMCRIFTARNCINRYLYTYTTWVYYRSSETHLFISLSRQAWPRTTSIVGLIYDVCVYFVKEVMKMILFFPPRELYDIGGFSFKKRENFWKPRANDPHFVPLAEWWCSRPGWEKFRQPEWWASSNFLWNVDRCVCTVILFLPWIFILFFGDFFVDGDNVPVFRPFVSPRKMRHNKSTGSFILSLVWNAYKQWSCLPNDLQSHSQDFYCAAPRQTEEEHFLAAFLTAFASVDGNERYQQSPSRQTILFLSEKKMILRDGVFVVSKL